jgi:hypothetical protein
MGRDFKNRVGDLDAFSGVFNILKSEEIDLDVYGSTFYNIDFVVGYIGKIIDYIDCSVDGVLTKNHPNGMVLENISKHYGAYPLSKVEQAVYLRDNLKKVLGQLKDLKSNPKEFHSRGDSGLIGLIDSIKLSLTDNPPYAISSG